MKMVKSLFLGAAAGLVAVAGAQAADLPVKAKPVQYVKICSLYGAGFYYIPGTDTCIKIGGFARAEWNWNANGSFSPNISSTAGNYTRAGQQLYARARFIATIDTRSQTAYGTLRSYVRAGWQWTSGDPQTGGSQGATSLTTGAGSGVNIVGSTSGGTAGAGFVAGGSQTYLDRVFVQLGGWTFGKTQSFFDFFNTGTYSLQTNFLYVDTGGSGTPVFAYTASLGNGITATVSAEDQSESRSPVVAVPTQPTGTAASARAYTNIFTPGNSNPSQNAAYMVPDFVANLRVDQAWGSAQIGGALHSVRASYYNSGSTTGAGFLLHPSDAWGYALNGGISFNLPMIAKGDTIAAQATYCSGAARYCSNVGGTANQGNMFGLRNNATIGAGWADDAYFDANTTTSSLQLSKMFSVVSGINHYWMPNVQQSLYGGYLKYQANSSAVDTLVCGVAAAAAVTAGVPATVAVGNGTPMTLTGQTAGCADWSAYNIGSRILWNPVTNMDVGLDVMYVKVKSAFNGATVAGGVGTPATLTLGDTNLWTGIIRIQRNFWP